MILLLLSFAGNRVVSLALRDDLDSDAGLDTSY